MRVLTSSSNDMYQLLCEGVYGFPKCPGINGTICNEIRKLLNMGAYVGLVLFSEISKRCAYFGVMLLVEQLLAVANQY